MTVPELLKTSHPAPSHPSRVQQCLLAPHTACHGSTRSRRWFLNGATRLGDRVSPLGALVHCALSTQAQCQHCSVSTLMQCQHCAVSTLVQCQHCAVSTLCSVNTGAVSALFSVNTVQCLHWCSVNTGAVSALCSVNTCAVSALVQCQNCAVQRLVTVCAASVTFSNSTFCPHSVCALCGSQNKQRLFTYTALTG
jgi:hypothetical protein